MKSFLRFVLLCLTLAVVAAPALAQLSGTKTIGGTSPDFPTIKAALQALTAQGTVAPGVTFLIRSGTYTEDSLVVRTSTASAGAPILIKPDAGATVVVNVTPVSATLPSCIKVDSTSYVTIDGSNSGGTSRNMELNSLGTLGTKGVLVYDNSNYVTVKNCVVRLGTLPPPTTARTITWEYAGAARNPHNGVIENNRVVGGYFGIRCEGYITGDVINNIAIRNNTVDSSGLYGIYAYYTNNPLIYGNEIMHVGTYNSTVYCLYMASVVNFGRAYNNKIHDPISTSASAGVYGIYEGGTSTLAQNSFFNNFIWNLNPPDAGTNTIYGIYCSTSNTAIPDTFAFNTVNLTGTSSGIKNSYAFYKGSATGPANVYNNIFQNTRTDGATGIATAIGKTTALTVLNSNNNNLYVGTPDAQHVTGRVGTTNYSTLNDWRTANVSDGASFTENAPFVSATDLHIQTTVPTQLESGGVPIAGMAFDIDNQARNATTPDVGADEGTFIRADFSSPLIAYTPLKNTALTTARTLTASVSDASGVPRSGIGLPVLYWRRNSGAYTGAQGTYVSGTQYSFTFGAGVVTGDTVSYFIAAQDSVTPPNVGVFPSTGAGGFTANPPAASTPPTNPSRYLIVQQPLAAGDYTVGLAAFERLIGKQLASKTFTRKVMREVPVGPMIDQKKVGSAATTSITPYEKTELREIEEQYSVLMDGSLPYSGPTRVLLTDEQRARFGIAAEVLGIYPTITAALNDLNLRGVSGSVRFLLVDASYPTETFPLTVNVTSDSVPTATKTVTIKPNTGVTATVSGASASGPIFKILNTNYFTIDGSNATGGTTRNLTIQNTSTTTPQVVLFGSLGTTPFTNCTLKNTIVINGVNTSSAVIISDGVTAGTQGYFNTVTIQNNDIRNAYIGVYGTGGTTPQTGNNLFYLQNVVNDTSMAYLGLYMQGVNGATVRQNDIGNFNVVGGQDDKGVWLASGTINAVVERNNIHDLGYSGTGGYGGHGVYVSSGVTSANDVVRNNMISHMWGDGYSYTGIPTDNPIGIVVVSTQTGVGVFYNSINLYGNTINHASALPMGILVSTGSVADIRDNLIVNKLGVTPAGLAYGAVGIYATTANTQFAAIDYNDYYVRPDSPMVRIIGKIGALDYTTLAAWAAASGGDTHSLNADVNFLTPTNLHISTAGPSPVDSAATPITGITDDFDGQARNATRPDVGADEFTVGGPAPIGILSIARNVRVPNAGDTLVVTARIVDSTGVGITADSLLYSINGTLQPALAFPRVTGTNTDGTYRGVIPGSANTNGARIEYQIYARSGAGGSVTTAIVGANSYFAGLSPLSLTGVRAMNASRQLLYANYYCRVTGTINGPNFTVLSGRISYTFQDAVGGMNVNRGSTTLPLNVGDSIVVFGVLGQFRGTTQLTPDSVNHITVVATARTVPVTEVTVNAFNANPEAYESRLIRETRLQRIRPTPAWGGNVSIPVYQNVLGDSTLMFIDADTPVPSGPEPAYPVNVTGIGGQFTSSASLYNDGYEIIPRSSADFTSPPPALSGNYNVGAGGQFPTLDSAFATLSAAGVSGPVTLSLTDTVYAGSDRPIGVTPPSARQQRQIDPLDPQFGNKRQQETGEVLEGTTGPNSVGALTLRGPIPGASATNRITIRPAANKVVNITSTGTWGINLLNSSYVTIDGIGLTGPTRLTINAPSATTGAILFQGNSDNNILQNTTVRTSFTLAEGVYLVADSATATPDGNTIQGNAILRALDGIVILGNATSFPNANRILRNQIGSPTDSIGEAGMYVQQGYNTVIDGNYIQNIRQAGTTYNLAGIWVATKHLNTQISNNVIRNVKVGATTTAAVFASGMYLFGTATDTTSGNYFNNMIYDLDYLGTVSGGTVRGLYASTGIRDTIAYNSIYLTGTAATVVTSGALYTSTHVGQVFRNNVVVNARTETGTGRAIAFYKLSTTSTIISNYNDLYVPTRALSYVGAVSTTNYTTLANWQATGQDSQSVSVMANFRTPDLHIDSTITTPLYGGGRPIAGITTDIDGQARNATTPCIGADEFSPAGGPTPGWTAQTSGVSISLNTVKAVDINTAWAGGNGGLVLRTINSGNTWSSVGAAPISGDVYNIDALDANTAFVTTSPSATYIYRTTNGGATWTQVYTLAGGFLDGIDMIDATTGYAVGDPVGGKWTVLKTTDGGASWARMATEPNQAASEAGWNNSFQALRSGGNDYLWFGTGNSRVYRSTDGGATWSFAATAFVNSYELQFDSPLQGVVGGNAAARTTDGGATWVPVTISGSGTITGVAGSGTMDYWATGTSAVYRSSDRGVTWASSYTGAFLHTDFVTVGANTRGWAVSGTGGIAAYYGTVTDVKTNDATLPTAYGLDQNYPNPFNPSTTIQYALPEQAAVTLRVYDLLGREVRTLIDDVQQPGWMKVVWDGRNNTGSQVATGIYFYRVDARGTGGQQFTTVKKAVLLK